jgi:hypothetical protein
VSCESPAIFRVALADGERRVIGKFTNRVSAAIRDDLQEPAA